MVSGLRVLITNNTLNLRAGSELYVRDLAIGLLRAGHSPVAYSTDLGEVAAEIRAASIPVVEDLGRLSDVPQVIHGHHHIETVTALTHFPSVPAIFVCHGWFPWEETPPIFPRIRRYVAASEVTRDRLVCEHGISPECVHMIGNFVDLDRFAVRGALPSRLRHAAILNNFAHEGSFVPPVREACERSGLELDVLGLESANPVSDAGQALAGYDLVFATGRSALEAVAVGAAVVLCDQNGVGPLVTSENFDDLRRVNFALRALRDPLTADSLIREIGRYDPVDAAAVRDRARAVAGLDGAVQELVDLYRIAIAEQSDGEKDSKVESRAISTYLRQLAPQLKGFYEARQEAERFSHEVQELRLQVDELHEVRQEAERFSHEVQELRLQVDELHEVRQEAERFRQDAERLDHELQELRSQLDELNDLLQQPKHRLVEQANTTLKRRLPLVHRLLRFVLRVDRSR